MGGCASSPISSKKGNGPAGCSHSTVKIIDAEGRMQEVRGPIRAGQVVSEEEGLYFLCSSECMHVGAHAPHVREDEELQVGQIYFLLPRSHYSHSPLSLPNLCSLAVKASTALASASPPGAETSLRPCHGRSYSLQMAAS